MNNSKNTGTGFKSSHYHLLEEKRKAKEKMKVIPICMQSSKELQGEISKPSSVINAKK